MGSIIPGYEYDIFISYRHNDNRSGWVTEFVGNLEKELAATIKNPLSVYFDSNPYDGLLETHNVDKSLEGKLKCLVFIPIISQTYCDPNSFAWKQEFCVYNKLAQNDDHGRDIMLNNGNVASRILPIKIHDLDPDDNAMLEAELGGVLRAIDFIYKQPGVNRPLNPTDHRNDNQNKTDYRNQLNKLANAMKEIMYGILRPSASITTIVSPVEEKVDSRHSIAVLPFSNMSSDVEQEYFSEGITENIIMELSTSPDMRVISRTSMMRYKQTTKSAPEIAAELDVKYILEGGVQARGNKVRINVHLVDADKDELIWSKIFLEGMNDLFEIQSHVAQVVSNELHASISPMQTSNIEAKPTTNLEAYDLYLKGRHAFNQWGLQGYRVATDYYMRAIALDPEFKLAYSALASSYSARMSWNGDLSPQEAQEQIETYLEESWKRGPSENDYLTKAFVEFFITKDFFSAERFLKQALELSANNANVLYTYSFLLNIMGRFEEALEWLNKAKSIDPLTVAYFNYQTISLFLKEKHEEALQTVKEGVKLYPAVLRFYDFMTRIYIAIERWEEAEKAALSGFRVAGIRPPSMVAYLAVAYVGLKDFDKSKQLLEELFKRSEANEKGVNFYIVYIFNAMGDTGSAMIWLNKARATNDVGLIWYEVDPLLKGLRDHANETGSIDFNAAENHINRMLENEMPQHPYHNIYHIKDVLSASLVIAGAEELNAEEIKILRVAALLHDVGFIRSSKDHEEHGAEMAREMLPRFGFMPELIEKITRMILATRLPQSPTTQLEKILCDADLDYLGREDFYETGNKLYNELKTHGLIDTEREWNLVQKTFLESHRFHTTYSKKHREDAKQERLKEIVDKLKKR